MLNSLSSDLSQTDRRSRRTSKKQEVHNFNIYSFISNWFQVLNLKPLGQVLCTKTQHIAIRLHVKQPKFRPLSDRPTVETDVQKIGGAQLQYIFIHFKLVSGSKPQTPRTSSLHKTQPIHCPDGRTDGQKSKPPKTPETYSKPPKTCFQTIFFFYPPDGRRPDGQGKNIMTLQLRWAGHKNFWLPCRATRCKFLVARQKEVVAPGNRLCETLC